MAKASGHIVHVDRTSVKPVTDRPPLRQTLTR
jgi:hypothetical protein